MTKSASAPLSGIRVVDFTSMIAGPYCSRLLADCGAEVLKIEERGGDHMRNGRPLRDGYSAYFASLNCGKKSCVIDLKSEGGRAVATDLIIASDIVLENFRPGVMKRLGLDYETLSVKKPELIYCSVSGFGQSGPRSHQPAYAPVVHAASGYDHAHFVYQGGGGKPAKTGIFVADVHSAVYAFGAIQTALVSRLRHGRGQHVDVALMDAMIGMLVYECQESQFPLEQPRHLYGPVTALDGFVNVAPVNQRNFEQLATATGNTQWITDARFASTASRSANYEALISELEKWTSTRSALECEQSLMKAGVPCSRYLSVEQAMNDPQSLARGTMAEVEDGAGTLKAPNAAFKISDGTVRARRHVPNLGQHTDEMLTKILGLSDVRIKELIGDGSVVCAGRSA
jgi:crotonobetainyl-CoA:carnitine CoA-transferase CaiB-like acyl-CoA transferase